MVKIPYDITDAKTDIETLYREVAVLEEQLFKKGVLEKPKKENKPEEGK